MVQDVISYLKSNKQTGILLLLDFEKLSIVLSGNIYGKASKNLILDPNSSAGLKHYIKIQ